MRVFADFSASPPGFYPEEMFPTPEGEDRHPSIPSEAVEIASEDYERFFSDSTGALRWRDGKLENLKEDRESFDNG